MADAECAAVAAVSSGALGLSRAIKQGMAACGRIDTATIAVDVRIGDDGLWLFMNGYALRCAYGLGGLSVRKAVWRPDGATIRCDTAFGEQVVELAVDGDVLRARTILTPQVEMLLHYWPRDLFPLGGDGDPLSARGTVEAAQRGYNAAVVFCCRTDGNHGSALYFQNLSALNPYFKATGTTPDGVVGGRWPELGYQPPTAPKFEDADDRPLAADVPVVMSDVRFTISPARCEGEQARAGAFLDMLAAVYATIDHPPLLSHDWQALARRTQQALKADRRLSVQ